MDYLCTSVFFLHNRFVMKYIARILLLLGILALYNSETLSQTAVKGVVISAQTRQPIPFASIAYYKSNHQKGVVADALGSFEISEDFPIQKIIVSSLGYITKEVPLSPSSREKKIVVRLDESPNELSELVVTTQHNPALRIIRKALENKSKNNFEQYPQFQYTSYQKTLIDFILSEGATAKDSMELLTKNSFKNHAAFINEMAIHTVKNNASQSSKIVAQKTSGFRDPMLSQVFATLFYKAIPFYNNTISLFNTPTTSTNISDNFMSPLSDGCLSRYNYELANTLVDTADSVFVIHYTPKKNSNFNALKGTMYISSNNYALKSIVSQPVEKGLVSFVYRQDYELTQGKWFPSRLEGQILWAGMSRNKNILPAYVISSHIKEVSYTVDSLKIAKERISVDEKSMLHSFEILQTLRTDTLTHREVRTYHILDSVGKKVNLDGWMYLIPKLSEGYFPWKKVDIDVNQLFIQNEHEGWRAGFGLRTNEQLSRYFSVGGYAGYGTKDKTWKYGGNVLLHFDKVGDTHLKFSYRNDLLEAGRDIFSQEINILSSGYLQNGQGYLYSRLLQYKTDLSFRPFRNMSIEVGMALNDLSSLYTDYLLDKQSIAKYRADALYISAQYGWGEQLATYIGKRYIENEGNPIFFANYTRGISSLRSNSLAYNKWEVGIEYRTFDARFGQSSVHLDLGWIDRALPHALMFTGEGTNSQGISFVVENQFQTMYPYEFLSDRYARLFFSHNFGSLLFKTRTFQPQFVLHHNMGWGNLSNPSLYGQTTKTMDKGYFESGWIVDRIFRASLMKTAYLNVGVGAFYRYGAYQNEKFKDNITAKLSLNLSFR